MKLPIDKAIREAVVHEVARVARDSGGCDESYGRPFHQLNLLTFEAFQAGLYES